MTNKVVSGEEMMFKEDIKLIESEIAKPFNINATSELIDREELIIIENEKAYSLGAQISASDKNKPYVKVYSSSFLLSEQSDLLEPENRYYTNNQSKLESLMDDFIKRSVKGITPKEDGSLKGCLGEVVSKELIAKINEAYTPLLKEFKDKKGLDDLSNEIYSNSIMSILTKKTGRMLINEDRTYSLLTIGEYLSLFKKAFEPKYFKSIVEKADNGATPEEISKDLLENKENIHEDAFPLIQNKIWHSDRSFKLFNGLNYYIPQVMGKKLELSKKYGELMEYKLKIMAAMNYR